MEQAEAPSKPLRVFLSYSHDSAEHAARVLDLADRLRDDGLDAWIDQYDPEPEDGWPRWMERQIEQADRVLAICTETYRRRFEGKETEGGQGADWEGAILTDQLYRRRRRFVVPVVFREDDAAHVPGPLRRFTYHVVGDDPGYWKLYGILTGQKPTPAPPIGSFKALAPRPRRSFLGSSTAAAFADLSPELEEYRQWAEQRFEFVELMGLGQGEIRLHLDEIYVPLRLSPFEGRHGELAKRELGDPVATTGPDMIAAEAVFRAGAERHAIVLGQPGSGKTTALKKLHRSCLAGSPRALGLASGTLPVFLRLRELDPRHLEGDLAAFLAAELKAVSGERLAPAVIAKLIAHARLLLLFDGLDEIADETHRTKALRFLVWELRSWPEARAVVSCRNAGWPSAAESPELDEGFARHDVRPFDDRQIATLIERWYREAAKTVPNFGADEALSAAARLNRTLLQDPEYGAQAIKELVSTPLYLTLLCVVVMKGGQIPRRRVDFYEECVGVLGGRWRQLTGSQAPVEVDQALEALGALAWKLHSQNRKEDLTEFEARAGIKKALGCDRQVAKETFHWLWKEAGLLARLNERQLGFPHLGLQEHLTARHLARHEDLLESVCGQYRQSWWKEVFLLLCGLPERSGFGPLMRGLLRQGALEDGMDLLAACLRETRLLDLEPFREILDGEDEARQAAALRLLARHAVPPVLELVEDFARSERPVSPAIAKQALTLLKAHASETDRRRREGVFLISHPDDRRPAERVRAELESRGMAVVNPPGADWEQCLDDAESAAGLLVLLGAGTLEAEHLRDAMEYFDDQVPRALRLPGDPRPPIPEPLADAGLVDLESFDDRSTFTSLVAALLDDAQPEEPMVEVAGVRSAESPGGMEPPFTEPLTEEVFLLVPAGSFEMGGTRHPDERPIHRVRLSSFWLARTPVTNRQYRLFLEATDRREPRYWRDRRFNEPDQPVVGVDWHDAVAFCQWLSEQSPTGRAFELPTEAQWEYAARGSDGREYPWGNEAPDAERACFGRNFSSDQPAAVGSFPAGAGPFGHLDLAGGVWEWCRDLWEPDYKRWSDEEPLDPIGEANPSLRPLRGGSWISDATYLRSAHRLRHEPGYRYVSIGFRVSSASSSTAP